MIAPQHLEGREREHNGAAAFGDAGHFGHRPAIVGDALQHVEAGGNVKRLGAERDARDVGAHERAAGEAPFCQAGRRQVEGKHASVRPQQRKVVPGPGAAVYEV
jgi:hypothetical protein